MHSCMPRLTMRNSNDCSNIFTMIAGDAPAVALLKGEIAEVALVIREVRNGLPHLCGLRFLCFSRFPCFVASQKWGAGAGRIALHCFSVGLATW